MSFKEWVDSILDTDVDLNDLDDDSYAELESLYNELN